MLRGTGCCRVLLGRLSCALRHHAQSLHSPCKPRCALQTPAATPPRPADCLFMETGLVAADRLYTTKRQILEELGLGGWQGGSEEGSGGWGGVGCR